MPLWKQYSGTWPLQTQMQARAVDNWTGLPRYSLYTWGRNLYGELGQNIAYTISRSSPVQVGAETTWSKLSVNNNVLAIKLDGTLWSWGSNNYGQLGSNSAVSRSSPVQVGALTNWDYIQATGSNSFAIKKDGTLWVWGRNNRGSLGISNAVSVSSPVQLGASTWSSVVGVDGAGYPATLGLQTNGTIWSWGSNYWGHLGLNLAYTANRSSPVQVGLLTTWSKIGATTSSFYAIKTDGTIWAWGLNDTGRLGIGNRIDRSSPVQIGALTNWASVAISQGGAIAAIKTDNTLWAWGTNDAGGLGIYGGARSSPTQVGALTDWADVSMGAYFTLATKTDKTLWSWGYNNYGQLGQNIVYSTDVSSPVQIGSSTWANPSCGIEVAGATVFTQTTT